MFFIISRICIPEWATMYYIISDINLPKLVIFYIIPDIGLPKSATFKILHYFRYQFT